MTKGATTQFWHTVATGWPTAMKNKKLLLGNIHDKPISGLYRVTEIVPNFPRPLFGLTTRKWYRSHFSIY